MNINNICDGVVYVGVNDRVTHRFESLWPIPRGVSYNSYYVKGSEATALIDTVEISELPVFLNHLREQNIEKIDYLIINHMEPDHSGSIAAIMREFPGLKIVGNRTSIGMIGGYYNITDPDCFHEVKDGDSLSLGDLTLSFHFIPMVHWPETMVTYVAERELVFSGDAFGSFGALNGGVMDTQMDCDWYFPEMERYYSNIVGKYGKFVQRALKKLEAVKLSYICPTHGPVWHDRIDEVVAVYDRLSRYEAEEGATIIYGSMYGNTAAAADTMARELCALGVKKIVVHNAAVSEMSDMIADAFRYKILVVASPTYSATLFPAVEQFLRAVETRELSGRVFATIGSHTWAGVVEKEIAAFLERTKSVSAGHVEIKQSSTAETDARLKELAAKLVAEC
ncbi:MAG: FprA family A-type flavoprotein [Duncaniella sp.]|nr:FprA family A-type flavoprotein [Duncaniella sp.]